MTVIFTTLLLFGATSAYAQTVGIQCGNLWELDHATVFQNPNEVSVLVVVGNCNNLLQNELFGYGALTDGTHVFGASHGGPNGFLDSAAQMGDNENPVPHNHLINVVAAVDDDQDPNDCFSKGQQLVGNAFLVTSLSFESPGVTMFGGTINTQIDDDEVKIWEVPKVLDGTDALTMTPEVFTLGNLGPNPPVLSVHLDPTASDGVCVIESDRVIASLEDLIKVGGVFLGVDTAALLIAGFQSSAIWMIPTIAGIAATGIYLTKFRANKED